MVGIAGDPAPARKRLTSEQRSEQQVRICRLAMDHGYHIHAIGRYAATLWKPFKPDRKIVGRKTALRYYTLTIDGFGGFHHQRDSFYDD